MEWLSLPAEAWRWLTLGLAVLSVILIVFNRWSTHSRLTSMEFRLLDRVAKLTFTVQNLQDNGNREKADIVLNPPRDPSDRRQVP